jgi:hypothetical protein
MKFVVVAAGVALWVGGYAFTAGHAQSPSQASAPTFSKDVAPILYKNCTGCHRAGEIGPMPLITYQDARPHATDMRDEVREGRMPPWYADPHYGKFENDRRLTDAEKSVIARWADAGAPRGDDKDLPPPPTYASGWSIGTPDAVISMPTEYEVPAKGIIEYQYFEMPTNFTEDKWVQAMEVRPGARAVVHHVLVYCREPVAAGRPQVLRMRADQGLPLPSAPLSGAQPAVPRRLGTLIATTAPGTNAMVFRPGSALQIKAGSVLTFQVHYTAAGQAMKDRSSFGIVFAKAAPQDEIRASQFVNGRFVIPAGAADYKVDSEVGFSDDVHIWGLFPHTHLRGKRWEYRLVYPEGRTETILSVPTYDFNWQTYYMFAEPLAVPKGSRIEASAWYDNSSMKSTNPDPKAEVRWGDQTWEEMQYTGLTYTVDSQHKTPPVPAGGSRKERQR